MQKSKILFEKLDEYVDILLDQVLLEYDKFGENEITKRTTDVKDVADVVADLMGKSVKPDDSVYIMPSNRAPVAAEL